MIAAHQTMLAPQVAPLPYDAEVEYLESTGTQYVDTGVVVGSDSGVDIVASSPNTTDYYALFGARTSGTERSFAVWQRAAATGASPGFRVDYYATGSGLSRFAFFHNWNTVGENSFSKIGEKNWLNGAQSDNIAASFSCDYSAYIFAVNSAGTAANPFVGRVFSLAISQSGVLVRDYIPVRVGSGAGAVGYLYDRVSGELFGNAGTGSFVVGSDK